MWTFKEFNKGYFTSKLSVPFSAVLLLIYYDILCSAQLWSLFIVLFWHPPFLFKFTTSFVSNFCLTEMWKFCFDVWFISPLLRQNPRLDQNWMLSWSTHSTQKVVLLPPHNCQNQPCESHHHLAFSGLVATLLTTKKFS